MEASNFFVYLGLVRTEPWLANDIPSELGNDADFLVRIDALLNW
jgi:hypothetical protein